MAKAEKDPNSPATTSDTYDRMLASWELVETLLGGTQAMRAAGEKYCPMHEEETFTGYQSRLQGAVLLNMVEQTLNQLAGKPFTEPVKLNDNVPPIIEDKIVPDVDMQGNSLHVFCHRWFREGMAKALVHVLVDMPRTPADMPTKTPRTLADDRKSGARPYWVLVKPENVIFASSVVESGAEVLQHVRILETFTEQNGFAEVERVRIRVLTPGHVQLWEPDPKKKRNGEPVWNLVDEWDTALDYIPLVTFYAHREAFMEGKPPLMDLAELNVSHWQSTADQRHILKVARFPILACSGATEGDSDPVVVGPNKVLYNPDPQGKFYYVEHTGKSIEAGRQDMKDLEERMAMYGTHFLRKKSGHQTATGQAIDSAEATSELASMAGVFEDAVAQALDMTADWLRIAGGVGGTVEVVKSYQDSTQDRYAIDALNKARANKDLSRKAYLDALMLYGILNEDFDVDANAEELTEEQASAFGKAMLDLNPAEPTPPAGPGNEPPVPPEQQSPAKGQPPVPAPAA